MGKSAWRALILRSRRAGEQTFDEAMRYVQESLDREIGGRGRD
jgi:hypothetical protein